MFFKDESQKKFNKPMYFVFLVIGGSTIATSWFILDVTVKVFLISALFAILLTMAALIVSRAFAEKNSETNTEINTKLDTLLEKFEANKPEIIKITQPKFDAKEFSNVIKEWEVVIQVQMHFNELLMKLRTATLSIVLAIFGAAGYSILSKDVYLLTFNNFSFHPSVIIIAAGLVLLVSMFIMDYFYYYKLLKGAVNRGKKFDEIFHTTDNTWKYFGLTTEISAQFGDNDNSRYSVAGFYIIPFVAGVLFLLGVLNGFNPS